MNDGTGLYVDSGQSFGLYETEAIAAGDVDGDGDMDIAVAVYMGTSDGVYLNDGTGVLSQFQQTLGLNWSMSVALVDVDDDSDLDLLSAVYSNRNTVHLNELTNPNSDLVVLSPNGSEVWEAGTTRDIIYSATGSVSSVSITLSVDAGVSWVPVAASIPASGTYSWLVSDVSSTACIIRVADASEVFPWDVSDNVFTIQQVNHTPIADADSDQTPWVARQSHSTALIPTTPMAIRL